MGKQLKISADVQHVKKSITDLAKMAQKDLGKSKIQLFSKDTDKLLKGEAKKALEEIQKVSTNIRSEIDKQLQSIKKTTQGTKEHRNEVTKLLKLQKDLLKVEKDRSDVSSIAGKGMAAKGLGGMLDGGKGGRGMFGGMLGGMGRFMMSPMGLGIGALAGAGMYGAGRMRAGVSRYDEGIDTRLQLRGRGIQDFGLTEGQKTRASIYGMSRQDLEARRLQSMDAFGRRGAGAEDVLGRARFERGTGLQGGTLTQLGAGFREQMGTQRANQAVMKLQASALASGIDDAIGPYLETAATMLTAINENGMSNQAEVLGALADLTSKTGEAPEIISKQLTTVDQTLRASTGERNAFAQTAFARAGIGGGSIGGTQMAIRSGGIFGADLSGLAPGQQETLRGMGMGGDFKGRSQALLDEFKNLGFKFGKGATGQDLAASGRGAMGFLGAKNEVEGLRMLNLLQRGAEGDKDAQKKLSELQKDPQLKNLEALNKSADSQLKALEKIRETIETEIGEKLTPVTIASRNALKQIDELIQVITPGVGAMAGALVDLLAFFGVSTDQHKAEEAAVGSRGLETSDIDALSGGEKTSLSRKMSSKYLQNQKSIAKTKARIASSTGSYLDRDPQERANLRKMQREQENIRESAATLGGTGDPEIKKLLIDILDATNEHKKATISTSEANIQNRKQVNKNGGSAAPVMQGGDKTYGN